MAGGAWVRDHDEDGFFSSNLDSFSGNSGEPVFNQDDFGSRAIWTGKEDVTRLKDVVITVAKGKKSFGLVR